MKVLVKRDFLRNKAFTRKYDKKVKNDTKM